MSADKATVAVRIAVDRFLASARCRRPTTRRSYAGVLDRVAARVGADRRLADVTGDELGQALTALWAAAAPSTWNQRRAAVSSFLAWCAKNGYPSPRLPTSLERQPERRDETRALDRAAIERLLTRRDVPLREKTLWRMLYETTARAGEILALNIEDLEPDARRARVTSKGGDIEYVYWASGTAHLLPRLIRGRDRGPVFLSERRPGPARRPAARDMCPHTGRARLGYDRARILLDRYTRTNATPGWDLHQLRHSAATHLGEANAGLQLIMAKGRWRNPRTAMRYVKPGAVALAEVTELLDTSPPRRR
ncbi:site-specific integrase [Micromonospora sp. WMMD718]|uniref:tyrosine-type recombinase/integrase n=1 Tax=unclassified Micromonospora TaxID=2617518 RepID=UPI00064BF484|nr:MULTISPECIES: site-specific integrase [unclassified Micromonospora]MDG4751581.1 site-specific integrase [Micromonospora sp. WMMD718]